MRSSQKIILIRHTKPDIDPSVCYGQLDVGVYTTFLDEARKINDVLKVGKHIQVYSSPLKRCHLLAQNLFPHKKLLLDNRLKEIDFGMWENIPWSEINKTEMDFWCEDFIYHTPYQGESYIALNDRVLSCFDMIKESGGDAVVVTHAGVIRAILADVLAIPLDKIFNVRLHYGAVIELTKLDKDNYSVDFML